MICDTFFSLLLRFTIFSILTIIYNSRAHISYLCIYKQCTNISLLRLFIFCCCFLFIYLFITFDFFFFVQAHMKFPPDYPYSPPSIRFMTKVWHPNVYEVSQNLDIIILTASSSISRLQYYKRKKKKLENFKLLSI